MPTIDTCADAREWALARYAELRNVPSTLDAITEHSKERRWNTITTGYARTCVLTAALKAGDYSGLGH